MTEYNDRMRAARKAVGLSYEAAAARASRLLLPSQEFTSSTARRTEEGPEEDADPIRLWALAQVFQVPLEELSPLAAQWFAGAVKSRKTRRRGPSDLGSDSSEWFTADDYEALVLDLADTPTHFAEVA